MHECAISRNENHLEDLISKKSLIATIEKEAGMNIHEWLRDTIMNARSAVVRCRDCKYNDTRECMGRDAFYGRKDDDFCSWGEAEGDNDGEIRN